MNTKSKNWKALLKELQRGDIFAIKGEGYLSRLQTNLILPQTDRFHYGLLGEYIKEENDFVILESIQKGTAVGRLSWYIKSDIKFYEVNDPDSKRLGKEASIQATKWGRAKYDYRVYIWIFWNAMKLFARQLWEEHRLRKVHITEFPPLPKDKRLLCTELGRESYRGIYPILPLPLAEFPAAYELARLTGSINLVAHWEGENG